MAKLVFLHAIDWTKYSGDWDNDFPFGLKEAYICGILLNETDDQIALCQVQFSTGSVRDILVVPKCNVLERKDFEV